MQTETLAQGVRDCVSLVLQDGRELICTPDHQILCADGRWVRADALVLGQYRVVVGLEAPLDEPSADEAGYELIAGDLRFTLDAPHERLRTLAFARLCLATELSFRANFLIKLLVEVLWLGILLVFYLTIFASPDQKIAGWTRDEYLFFVGCHYALGGVIETFFLHNCTEFADLVRSGDLDLYLLKPIDEQFLITTRTIDWSTLPNVLLGAGVMAVALHNLHWAFDPLRLARAHTGRNRIRKFEGHYHGWMDSVRGSGVVIPASSRTRMCEP